MERKIPMPGAVRISLDPADEPEPFYADGVACWMIDNNQGYDGDLEPALIPESFRIDVMKEEADTNGVLLENISSQNGAGPEGNKPCVFVRRPRSTGRRQSLKPLPPFRASVV